MFDPDDKSNSFDLVCLTRVYVIQALSMKQIIFLVYKTINNNNNNDDLYVHRAHHTLTQYVSIENYIIIVHSLSI